MLAIKRVKYCAHQVKICDFGLARSLDTDGAKAITLSTLLPVAWYVHQLN